MTNAYPFETERVYGAAAKRLLYMVTKQAIAISVKMQICRFLRRGGSA